METILSRYRNLTVLLVVVFTQLVYLAYQVKSNRDERMIRVWAVTAVTPMAGLVEGIRRNTVGFLQDYFILLDVREQNRKLKYDNDHLRLENVYFRNQLRTAEHARALNLFQAQTPSLTIPARVIGDSTVVTAKAVFIDRGSASRVEKGMAVVTPEGIVGKVIAVYPLVAQVLLVTDPTFKVGVESQKGHVHGVLNCGSGKCQVEQIQNEEKVSEGEWFYTSGEDRIFPKGFPVGTVVGVQSSAGMKDVHLSLSGAPGGTEEVLVVLQGIHQNIPSEPPEARVSEAHMPPPPPENGDKDQPVAKGQTEADKVLERYQTIGKEQGHVFGGVGSPVPNFNSKPASRTPPEQTQTTDAATTAKSDANASEAKQPITSNSSATKPPSSATSAQPSVLGSRPGANTNTGANTPQITATKPNSAASGKPDVTVPAKPAAPRPSLPLGAHRPRPTDTTSTNAPPQ